MPNSDRVQRNLLELIAALLNVEPKLLVGTVKQRLLDCVRSHQRVLILVTQIKLNELSGLDKLFGELRQCMPVSISNRNGGTITSSLNSSLHGFERIGVGIKNTLLY